MADKVFMYGPFMGGYDLAEELKNYQFMTHIGRGRAVGKMYDIGDHPAVVTTDAPPSYVYGDVYEVSSEETLHMLDEGAGAIGEDPTLYQFRRYIVPVTMQDQTVVQAWLFFYNQPMEGFPLIPSGDYKVHKAEEKKFSRRGFFTRLFPKMD